MAEDREPISRFEEYIHPFRDIWKSLDVRTVLCLREAGWHNILTSIRMSPEAPCSTHQMAPVLIGYDFYANRFQVDAKYLALLLGELRKGQTALADREVFVARRGRAHDGQPTWENPSPYSWQAEQYSRRNVGFYTRLSPEYPGYVLKGTGEGFGTYWGQAAWRQLESRLLAHDPPFRGMNDLGRSLIGYPYEVSYGGMADFTVLAPLYARLEPESELRGGSLEVRCSGAVTARAQDFRLASILGGPGDARRFSHTIAEEDADRVGDRLNMKKAIPVGDSEEVEIHLIFRTEAIDSVSLYPPSSATENPRLWTHWHFDPDLSKLDQFLSPDPDDKRAADAFDLAVGWILHLCGFQVANYGLKGLSLGDEVDVVALVPYSRSLMAVEVTWRDILNKDKLTKFRRRVDDLATDLPGHDITAAIVTAFESTYGTEKDEASGLGISIVRPPDLRRLLEIAERNQPASDAVDFIRRLRPGPYRV